MAISPQQLTIYLYSTHRAVIFAIAQLSCLTLVHHKYRKGPTEQQVLRVLIGSID